jgi:hypothetical protein
MINISQIIVENYVKDSKKRLKFKYLCGNLTNKKKVDTNK